MPWVREVGFGDGLAGRVRVDARPSPSVYWRSSISPAIVFEQRSRVTGPSPAITLAQAPADPHDLRADPAQTVGMIGASCRECGEDLRDPLEVDDAIPSAARLGAECEAKAARRRLLGKGARKNGDGDRPAVFCGPVSAVQLARKSRSAALN